METQFPAFINALACSSKKEPIKGLSGDLYQLGITKICMGHTNQNFTMLKGVMLHACHFEVIGFVLIYFFSEGSRAYALLIYCCAEASSPLKR